MYFFLYSYFVLQVNFRRPPTHENNNLIAIIPTDSENDTQTNSSISKNIPKINDSLLTGSDGKIPFDSQNIEGTYFD